MIIVALCLLAFAALVTRAAWMWAQAGFAL
jgi:hypothetical protein